MDISGVISTFTAILIASAIFLYIGTIGIKSDTQDDQLYKQNQVEK
jgi:hypothetical protein